MAETANRRYLVEGISPWSAAPTMREGREFIGSRSTKKAAIALAERTWKAPFTRRGLRDVSVIDTKTHYVIWSNGAPR